MNYKRGEEAERMRFDSLQDVLADQIGDLRSAEGQLIEALPKVIAAVHSDELRTALENHLQETQGHLQRLQDVIPTLGVTVPMETCEGMKGLLEEGEEIVAAQGDPLAKDAALIAAAQRVEHYEIAAYGTARTLADELGLDDAKEALDQTLDEEANADKLLTKIATGGMFRAGINQEAAGRS
jgi:ferritin-like metal-binding protein YciE